MNAFQAWQLLLVCVAGWINRHQLDAIANIQEENKILKSKLKGKRIRFTDEERRRLAVKGKCNQSNYDMSIMSLPGFSTAMLPFAVKILWQRAVRHRTPTRLASLRKPLA